MKLLEITTARMLAFAGVISVSLSSVAWADQPAASCAYSTENAEINLQVSRAGEGLLSGMLSGVEFSCPVTLADIKDCRRCASIVDHILTFDRGACKTIPSNAPYGELSNRMSLHIYRMHAELGLLAGETRIKCHTYSLDLNSAFYKTFLKNE